MKVLVTGAVGFIGTNLCERLLQEGHEVIGLDDLSGLYKKSNYDDNIKILTDHPKGTFVQGSILDTDKVFSLKGKSITHVVHLAAKAGVRDSVENPKIYLETNLIGTQNILELVAQEKISSIVLASSSSVYGSNKTPFVESMSLSTPLNPYAASKIGMEALAYSYHHVHKLPITLLRFFTVYGPRGRTDMAAYIFCKAINDGKKITIHGDGSQKRDFTFVNDIVDGILESMKLNSGFNVFNLGRSDPVILNDMIGLMEKNLGKTAQKEFIDFNFADSKETFADISKAKKELNFSPKVSLEEGIGLFVKWFKDSKQ